MILILSIYILIGSFSFIQNLGKWFFSSYFFMILFLPFMIVHAFIYGDKKKKKEAIVILKGLIVLTLIYFLIVGVIVLFQRK